MVSQDNFCFQTALIKILHFSAVLAKAKESTRLCVWLETDLVLKKLLFLSASVLSPCLDTDIRAVYHRAGGIANGPPAMGVCLLQTPDLFCYTHSSWLSRPDHKNKLYVQIKLWDLYYLNNLFTLWPLGAPVYVFLILFFKPSPLLPRPSSSLYSLPSRISVKFPRALVMFVSNVVPPKLQVPHFLGCLLSLLIDV